jgi:hypothetical protein
VKILEETIGVNLFIAEIIGKFLRKCKNSTEELKLLFLEEVNISSNK